ncbi:hypothetical protein [Massilia sp. TWP1-3-3]|uniref:hypothetical protein n=1 Tax=Massilia sp. TWP1-3-3 TaxID=2804573 RepID=UPI003CF53BAC
MKKLIALSAIAISVSMAISGQALAHGAKPKHGGVINSARDLTFELVGKDGKAVIYVDDHGANLATAGATGTLTVLSGGKKSETVLQPSGANTLTSKTPIQLAGGAKAVASITLAGKEAVSVRFSHK